MNTPKLAFFAALGAALSLGCSAEEQLSPVPVDAGSMEAGPMDAGGGGAGGTGGTDAGLPKRTVIQRNPYGNVAETDNLLWDGDFEWWSPFSDQYGWLAGSTAQTLDFTFSGVRLGPDCHSGIRCAVLKKKNVIAGIAVAWKNENLAVSFWAKPASGGCNKVSGAITDFTGGADPSVAIHPVTPPSRTRTGGVATRASSIRARTSRCSSSRTTPMVT